MQRLPDRAVREPDALRQTRGSASEDHYDVVSIRCGVGKRFGRFRRGPFGEEACGNFDLPDAIAAEHGRHQQFAFRQEAAGTRYPVCPKNDRVHKDPPRARCRKALGVDLVAEPWFGEDRHTTERRHGNRRGREGDTVRCLDDRGVALVEPLAPQLVLKPDNLPAQFAPSDRRSIRLANSDACVPGGQLREELCGEVHRGRAASVCQDEAAQREAGTGPAEQEFVAAMQSAGLHRLIQRQRQGRRDAIAEPVEGNHDLVVIDTVPPKRSEGEQARLMRNDEFDRTR